MDVNRLIHPLHIRERQALIVAIRSAVTEARRAGVPDRKIAQDIRMIANAIEEGR